MSQFSSILDCSSSRVSPSGFSACLRKETDRGEKEDPAGIDGEIRSAEEELQVAYSLWTKFLIRRFRGVELILEEEKSVPVAF
jgi:hypothetical protein